VAELAAARRREVVLADDGIFVEEHEQERHYKYAPGRVN
jgi:hypothetical protein